MVKTTQTSSSVSRQNTRVVAYGDSLADGIATSNHGVINAGISGCGLNSPSNMPSTDKIQPGDTVIFSVGRNDWEIPNKGEAGYQLYVERVRNKIAELKAANGGAPVVLLGLEQVADSKAYGTADQNKVVNRALQEAAGQSGAQFFTPTTVNGRPRKDGVVQEKNPHYNDSGYQQLFKQAMSQAGQAGQQQNIDSNTPPAPTPAPAGASATSPYSTNTSPAATQQQTAAADNKTDEKPDFTKMFASNPVLAIFAMFMQAMMQKGGLEKMFHQDPATETQTASNTPAASQPPQEHATRRRAATADSSPDQPKGDAVEQAQNVLKGTGITKVADAGNYNNLPIDLAAFRAARSVG